MLRRISSLFPWQGLSSQAHDTRPSIRAAGGHDVRSGTPFGLLAHPYTVTALCFSLVILLAIENHFIQDDGFITLRYVDNFLNGHGPVWYPGSDEFGYTNFLFMLLVTGVSLTGLDPVVSASIVSYSAFFAGAGACYLIVRRLTGGNGVVAALAVAVAFSNFTVSSYASGLLETSLQLACITLTYYCALVFTERMDAPRYVYLATAAATLGLLTRLDSVLLIAPVFLFMFFRIWTAAPDSRRRMIGHTAVALAISAVVLSGFFAYCLELYGHFLPNTFYAKAGRNLAFGGFYLSSFLFRELFIYLTLAAIILLHFRRAEGRLPRLGQIGGYGLALAATGTLWMAYVVYVGGGFMGFRLMVPFIVIFFLLAFSVMGKRFGTAFAMQMAVIALLTQGAQYFWFSRTDDVLENVIETPAALELHLTYPDRNWTILGQRLHELFYHGEPTDVRIAVAAAGAIPYFSRLPAFDIHGLNTREVAKHAPVVGGRPGHRKVATLPQMQQAGVNLIMTAQYLCTSDVQAVSYEDLPWREHWPELSAVLIPMSSDRCWTVSYYLRPHPDIDHWIARNRLVRIAAT